jgi:hypothetical protein
VAFKENMYGGLFGDLPATKKKSTHSTTSTNTDRKGDDDDDDDATATAAAVANGSCTRGKNIPKPSFVPRMFIPTQASSRPRSKQQQPPPPPPPQPVKKRPAPAVSSTQTSSDQVLIPLRHTDTTTTTSNITTKTKTLATDENLSHEIPPAPSLQKSSSKPLETEMTENDDEEEASSTALSSIDNNENCYYPESDDLTRLHERAKRDPYDPFVPNDLLAYWEREAAEEQRQRLVRERQEALEAQEQLRLRLKRERNEILASGNIDRIVEFQLQQQQQQQQQQQHHSSVPPLDGIHHNSSLGRGRGAAKNLPAWLVEKQRKEREQMQSEPTKE